MTDGNIPSAKPTTEEVIEEHEKKHKSDKAKMKKKIKKLEEVVEILRIRNSNLEDEILKLSSRVDALERRNIQIDGYLRS